MDGLFSIPVLSFLLIPTVSSYSTSLNLLFFYITWSTLVLSHPPIKVELVGTAAVRVIFYLAPSILFFLFDVLLPSAAIVLKAQGKAGLPSGSRKRKNGKRAFKIAGWGVFNLFLSMAVQWALEYVLTKGIGVRSALKVSTTLPMPWGIAKDLLKGMVTREVLQYVIHRYVLHSNSFIGRYHQSWYHSLKSPSPLTAHYDHPLSYLLSTFIPTYGPAAIFRFHLLTYLIYLSLVSVEETFAYSGYSTMPTNFFLGGIARRIEMHISSDGEGNFGPWGILDWICGTAVGDTIEDDIREEFEEADIDEKMYRMMEKSKKKTRAAAAKGKTRRRRNS
ncbi:hypothetical protein FQN54_001970 [Arachnomyces sp. PD_36]|nr:hypothetical protein FQN54_001970 [Arachnomyces sp. PD_36]